MPGPCGVGAARLCLGHPFGRRGAPSRRRTVKGLTPRRGRGEVLGSFGGTWRVRGRRSRGLIPCLYSCRVGAVRLCTCPRVSVGAGVGSAGMIDVSLTRRSHPRARRVDGGRHVARRAPPQPRRHSGSRSGRRPPAPRRVTGAASAEATGGWGMAAPLRPGRGCNSMPVRRRPRWQRVGRAPRDWTCVTDRPDRYVDINLATRSVVCDGEEAAYSGVLLTFYEHDDRVNTVWLPQGETPTLRDRALAVERTARALAWAGAAPQH